MMNTLTSIVICFLICSCSKRAKEERIDNTALQELFEADYEDLPEPWNEMEYLPEDYITMQPKRPLIISFVSSWSLTTDIQWKILYTNRVCNQLKDMGALCILADLTKDNPIASKALTKLDRTTLPLTIIYDPKHKKWIYLSEIFDEEYLLKALSDINKAYQIPTK